MSVILTNARLILAETEINGTVVIDGPTITEIQPGRSQAPGAIDLEGDYLMPGAVDLHTDNLERQVEPRGGARWPSRAAFLAHDAQCAAAGVTTVLDALCLGDMGFDDDRQRTCLDGVADLDTLGAAGLLKSDHYLHLRCEVPAPGAPALLAALAGHAALRMVSLMDHTPGIGQYGDLARYRRMRERDGESPDDTARRIAILTARRRESAAIHRAALLAILRDSSVAVASHDDRTEEEVAANVADGIRISEFPVSLEAAAAARAGGMAIIGGAPNVVRGGSHSGNVSASTLIEARLLDALASDYVPASMFHAAFIAAGWSGLGLPRAIGLVTHAPACMVGLADRGRIAPGFRADLVRARVFDGIPVIQSVFCAGLRVA
jgi:alpha-D-ribose 1-methylphosphonate 5-triphosphate diphosphatase